MTEEQDWKSLCTLDKIEHKNWNARIDGYKSALSDMAKANDAKDPLFNQYLGVMKKMVLDSNVVAQEKALEVVLYYVEESNAAGKVAGDICTGLIAKCISSLRPITKERSVSILKMLIEIEKQEVVFEELLKGLVSKAPKVVVGSIIVFREALSEFGPKVVPIKELFKLLPQLLEDRDKGVRDAGKELIIEICRWIGRQAITPQMSNFKPVQVTELNAEFDKIPPVKPIPSRYLKSQKPKVLPQVVAVDGGNGQIQNAAVNPQPVLDVDPYEFVEPVEVISKIPNDFYDKIEEKKWTDRKEALEVVDKLTNHMKLVPGDFADLNKALLKIVTNDANVVLVMLSCKILMQLSNGLRKKYSPYAVSTLQKCLGKFKERKITVVKMLRDCVDSVYKTTTLEAIVPTIINAFSNKNPSVKLEAALFLNRIFLKSPKNIFSKRILKQIIPSVMSLSLDNTLDVREASFQIIGTAMKVVSESDVMPYLEGVDNIRMSRINEFFEKKDEEIVVVPKIVPNTKKQRIVETRTIEEPVTIIEEFDEPPIPGTENQKDVSIFQNSESIMLQVSSGDTGTKINEHICEETVDYERIKKVIDTNSGDSKSLKRKRIDVEEKVDAAEKENIAHSMKSKQTSVDADEYRNTINLMTVNEDVHLSSYLWSQDTKKRLDRCNKHYEILSKNPTKRFIADIACHDLGNSYRTIQYITSLDLLADRQFIKDYGTLFFIVCVRQLKTVDEQMSTQGASASGVNLSLIQDLLHAIKLIMTDDQLSGLLDDEVLIATLSVFTSLFDTLKGDDDTGDIIRWLRASAMHVFRRILAEPPFSTRGLQETLDRLYDEHLRLSPEHDHREEAEEHQEHLLLATPHLDQLLARLARIERDLCGSL